MVLFDPQGKIKKYDSVLDILKEFYNLRLTFYDKRKEHLLSQLRKQLEMLDNKVRFLLAIIEGKLVINKKKKDALLKELIQMKFKPFPKEKSRSSEAPEANVKAE